MPQHGVDFEGIAFRGVRGKGLRTLLLGPYALLAACVQARRVLRRRRPTSCSGFGGFASFPGALMGRRAQTRRSSSTTSTRRRDSRTACSRTARTAMLPGFPRRAGRGRDKRVEWVGNPLRDDDRARCRRPPSASPARTGPLRVLVVGGSLGAQALNEIVPAALALIPADRPADRHAPGGREAHRRAARRVCARRRDRRVRGVHRRHGRALRVGRRRDRRAARRRSPSWPRSAWRERLVPLPAMRGRPQVANAQ